MANKLASTTGGAPSASLGTGLVWSVVGGLCLASSVPPLGWWPLAFAAFFCVDRALQNRSVRSRFWLMWLATVAWMYPAMLFMYDLTAPGYVLIVPIFGLYYGVAAGLTPGDTNRRWVFPGAIALAEWARWSWPFGGVPLAHIGLSQVNSPIGQVARLGGPLFVVVLVVAVGQSFSALRDRQWRPAAVGSAVVAFALVGAGFSPRAEATGELNVALVQGGGPQQTRASARQQPVVLGRHVEASNLINEPVDLIVWPENVVNPGLLLPLENAQQAVQQVAAEHDAPVLAGWFYAVSDTETVNYQSVINPDGSETDRYEKVILVPFGEYVPARALLETLSDELPSRDVQRGQTDSVLSTNVGEVGVAISWEGFFEQRYRAAANDGAEFTINPTNASSYWLTQVQTQQVASNQLRAIETDRWVMQVGPTGLTAFIDPDGNVIQRTEISERATIIDRVERRQGTTLATRVGPWPVLVYSSVAVAASLVLVTRRRRWFGKEAVQEKKLGDPDQEITHKVGSIDHQT